MATEQIWLWNRHQVPEKVFIRIIITKLQTIVDKCLHESHVQCGCCHILLVHHHTQPDVLLPQTGTITSGPHSLTVIGICVCHRLCLHRPSELFSTYMYLIAKAHSTACEVSHHGTCLHQPLLTHCQPLLIHCLWTIVLPTTDKTTEVLLDLHNLT